MVDEALTEYINRQLQNGHSANEIMQFLVERGYQYNDVQDCLNEIYGQNPNNNTLSKKSSEKNHARMHLIIILIFIIIIIGLSLTMLIGLGEEKEISAYYNIDLIINEFNKEESMKFDHIIKNTGDSQSFRARIVYTIFDDEGEIIETFNKQEYVTEEKISEITLDISRYDPGRYSIKGVMFYGSKSEERTATFFVKEPKNDKNTNLDDNNSDNTNTYQRQCPAIISDNNPCTEDKCGPTTDYRVIHKPIVPCCNNGKCETGEKESCPDDCEETEEIEENNKEETSVSKIELFEPETPLVEQIKIISEIGKKDTFKAAKLCDSIDYPYYKDECFYELAQSSGNEEMCNNINQSHTKDKCYTKMSKLSEDSSVCEEIDSELRRDSCYMRFALKGDYTVCNRIIDEYYKNSCKQLEDISQESPEVMEEYSKD